MNQNETSLTLKAFDTLILKEFPNQSRKKMYTACSDLFESEMNKEEVSTFQIASYTANEELYRNNMLSIKARGLFVWERTEDDRHIVIRGYDKFFNGNSLLLNGSSG